MLRHVFDCPTERLKSMDAIEAVPTEISGKSRTTKGHGPDGVIGDTQNAQTVAQWVYSRNAVQTLTNDLRIMSGDSDSVQMTHCLTCCS